MTTTNEHTERAEFIRKLKELADALPFEGGKAMDYAAELVAKAAALLEAQRPALKPLTEQEIDILAAQILEYDDAEKQIEFARAIEAAHGIKEEE